MTTTKVLQHLSAVLGSACLLLLSVRAEDAGPVAEDRADSEFYLRASVALQHRERASDSAGSTTFKTGFVIDGALGYALRAHRFEAEVSQFNNRCKTTDPAGDFIGVEPSSGNVDVDALMANYAYELPLGGSRLSLYLGGGVGLCRVSINGLTTPSLRTLPAEWGGPVIVYAESDWATAYQVRAGVTFQPRPRLHILLGYRLLKSSTLDINLADGSTIHPDARLHALEAAVRYTF